MKRKPYLCASHIEIPLGRWSSLTFVWPFKKAVPVLSGYGGWRLDLTTHVEYHKYTKHMQLGDKYLYEFDGRWYFNLIVLGFGFSLFVGAELR